MSRYSYVYPFVTVGPSRQLDVMSALSPTELADALGNADTVVEVRRLLMHRATLVEERRSVLRLRQGVWDDSRGLAYRATAQERYDWQQPDGIPYVETHVVVLEGRGFLSPFPPAFYSVYSGAEAKSILSDNNLKYGDDRLATQFRAFRRLVVGYPACFVDSARDLGESLLLINPYLTAATVNVELEGVADRRRLSVEAQRILRVPLADWPAAGSVDSILS